MNTCTMNPCVAAAIGFVAGVIVSTVACKLKCKCSKGKSNAPAKKGKDNKKDKKYDAPIAKTRPAPADGSIEIYVGNLSYEMTDAQMLELFTPYGKVNSARIIMNKYNGKSKGFGFVQMPNREEADKAVAEINDKEYLGRKIKCNIAKNVMD